MDRPRLLDLFCGAGGAAAGYAAVGFDVVGVDIKPQKHYPFTFVQADAMTYPLDGFDAVHASVPCQGYSALHQLAWIKHSKTYPMLIDSMRERLVDWGGLWIIENVPQAPLPGAVVICGTALGMPIRRHRLFESNTLLFAPGPCQHGANDLGIYGEGVHRLGTKGPTYRAGSGRTHARPLKAKTADAREAMGIDWMTLPELCQAIPPAYTEFLGRQLLAAISYRAA